MVKTNRVIYPFKINLNGINLERLKEDFKEEKKFDNFIYLNETGCRASLSFIDEEEGVMFFTLSKCDDNNIAVTDFVERKDYKSFLKPQQKVKQYSLFAIIPECNTILVLFNYNGFIYLIPALNKYFENKIKKKIISKIITRDYHDEDIKGFCNHAKNLVIERARETPLTYSKESEGSSREKIRKYVERKIETIKISRIKGMPPQGIFSIVQDYLNRNEYDSIIINTDTMEKFDILDEYVVNFKYIIGVDRDGLAKIDEFKTAIKEIKKNNLKLFSKFQLPSSETK